MNDKTHEPDSKVSARRRLIRGAFAAPAALTLYSGSVAARSLRNCVTNQADTPNLTPVLTTDEGTTYLRVQLKKFYGKKGTTVLTNRYSRWISGADLVSRQAAGTAAPYLASGKWQLYDRGTTNATSSCSTSGNPPFNPKSVYANDSTPVGYVLSGTTPNEGGTVVCGRGSVTVDGYGPVGDKWVALRVNRNGDIIGVVGINGSEGTAISQSCWTSFRVG